MEPFLSMTRAVADPTRMRILVILRHGELCLGELVDRLDLAASTVSRHLSILTDCGLVTRRVTGRWHYFSLRTEEPHPAATQLLEWMAEYIKDLPPVASAAGSH